MPAISEPPPTAGERRPTGRALVAGAAGFLGREIVQAFSRRGWEVRGLIRDPSKADRVRSAGGVPVVGDVLDRATLQRHSEGCRVLIHLAANPTMDPDLPELEREVRVQGTVNLVAAARASGARRLVVGSGYWVYADQPGPITEVSAVDPQGESRINFDTERAGLEANAPSHLEVVVVRPGMVYGDGAWFRPVLEAVRARTYRVIDGGRNAWSFVSLPDTAVGFYTVALDGRPGEIYNIVDGNPRPWIDFVSYVAARVGAHRPESESFSEAVAKYGPTVATHLRANRAASVAKLTALGWRPEYPRFEEGIDALLAQMGLGAAAPRPPPTG